VSREQAGSTVHVGALIGAAAPFNRRRDQVATLGGGSISIGLGFGQLGMWLDLDSFGNRDASHGTILLSGGLAVPVSSHLSIGGRFGLGATLVNFDDPAFRDVVGTTGRFEAMVDYRLGESWVLWLRPLALDVLSAADLGGPIASWQARLGVAYQFTFGRRTAIAPPPPAAAPAAPYPAPPAPYPAQPPAPYPAQPPAAPPRSP
jgi:hypothetical protein